MNGNHDLKSNLVRGCTPYIDELNHYIFNCKKDNWVEESLTCYFLKSSVKFDHFQRVSDWWQ